MYRVLRGAAGGAGLLSCWVLHDALAPVASPLVAAEKQQQRFHGFLPSRQQQLQSLREREFDVLVVGGGATGAGCALDAASRGLNTALVEMDDFSAGTSSRSTKLLHGGVRYLQKAIMSLDREQYRMVREALNERANLLQIAPHLSYPLPIMLPVYKWWQMPYFYAGIKMYDLVAGSKRLESSYLLSKRHALRLFPMLKKDSLVGAIVYYDGQHDDARMNVSIVCTAVRLGASVANHCKVVELIREPAETTGRGEQEEQQRICGAVCEDQLTGERFNVRARCVINACGPFTDSLRAMDDAKQPAICAPSAGVHVVLPGYYSPDSMGLLDPATSDGRVIFFLPWMKHTIAGTTDAPCPVSAEPSPREQDISFILNEVRNYLGSEIEVRRGDVLSAWSGIRPLVRDPNRPDTQSIARNHVVHVSKTGLITIAGGKWTTYRSMAQETIDAAVSACGLKPTSGCRTEGLLLEGAHEWTPNMYIRLVQDLGMDPEVAQHLANTYGDRSFAVARLCSPTGLQWPVIGRRLHEQYPYVEGEIRYAVREYAATATDVVARRMRLAFLNSVSCDSVLERVVAIMAEELGWSEKQKQQQLVDTRQFLQQQMGQMVNRQSLEQATFNLSVGEVQELTQAFQRLDVKSRGEVSVSDLRKHLPQLSGPVLHSLLSRTDPNHHGTVDLASYLQIMASLKSGVSTAGGVAPLATTVVSAPESASKKIPVERSGGGL